MKRISTSFLCLALCAAALLLSSCGYWSSSDNREKLKQLKVGMSKQEVSAIMGEPDKNEVYNSPNVWFYYTDPKWSDGAITRDECSPVVFENEKLVGWGRDFYKVNYEFKDWSEPVKKDMSDPDEAK